jgi:hypothetical protein
MPVAYCRAYRLLPPGEGGMLPSGIHAGARRADEGNSDFAPALDPRKVSAIGQECRWSCICGLSWLLDRGTGLMAIYG